MSLYLVPRADIRPEEGCFTAVTCDGKIAGYVQVFKDGSAGYWRELMDQAKPATSVDVALAILAKEWDRLIEVSAQTDDASRPDRATP